MKYFSRLIALLTLCLFTLACDKDKEDREYNYTPETIIHTAWDGTISFRDADVYREFEVGISFKDGESGDYVVFDEDGHEVESVKMRYTFTGKILDIANNFAGGLLLAEEWWVVKSTENHITLKSNIHNDRETSTLDLYRKH